MGNNTEFWGEVLGGRSKEAEIVRGCTAKLRAPPNDVIHPQNGLHRAN